MADITNKHYQSINHYVDKGDKWLKNSRRKRLAWVKAEMKRAIRKIRRNNKKIEMEK